MNLIATSMANGNDEMITTNELFVYWHCCYVNKQGFINFFLILTTRKINDHNQFTKLKIDDENDATSKECLYVGVKALVSKLPLNDVRFGELKDI